jgi:hypothetical protein
VVGVIPRLVIVCELEADPVILVEGDSAEDEAALFAWAEALARPEYGELAARALELACERRAA